MKFRDLLVEINESRVKIYIYIYIWKEFQSSDQTSWNDGCVDLQKSSDIMRVVLEGPGSDPLFLLLS